MGARESKRTQTSTHQSLAAALRRGASRPFRGALDSAGVVSYLAMVAKRWSPLCVFLGGCLSGAAVIGLHWGGGGPELPPNSGGSEVTHASESPIEKAGLVGERDCPEHEGETSTHRAADAVEFVTARPTDTGNGNNPSAEAGKSVADVLARLEAEYRRQVAPAQADEMTTPVTADFARPLPNEQPLEISRQQEQNSVSEPASDTRMATLPAKPAPISSAEEIPARSEPTPGVSERALIDGGQQQVTAQIQELAALQQVALVQQFALLQYLQLLSLAPSPGAAAPPPRRVPSGRMVAGFASSISDTNNPWGFNLPPTVLVR